MKKIFIAILMILLMSVFIQVNADSNDNGKQKFTIVDTGQERCFNNNIEIAYPSNNNSFYGQDAQYESNPPAYHDNGDGTISDLNTGLMWQKTPDFVKRNLADSHKYADSLKLAGHDDWRLPTIKELFSIADFNGNMRTQTPYIDTRYFDFQYPDTSQGWRIMDAQYRSSTEYIGKTMRGEGSVFGFIFADGRIKGYPKGNRGAGRQYVRCVRGKNYGENDFKDNGDGTVTDWATGLIWMKIDSRKTMSWEQALEYAETLNYAGHDDWRLPNVKELQSIVDYTRAPDAEDEKAQAAAIDPVFSLTEMESWFWTNTTHIENGGGYYVCFGQGFSAWQWRGKKMNAHGAGAVRSDPKTGDAKDYPNGKGPQGDEIRINNYVRCVRGGNVKKNPSGPALDPTLKRMGRPMGQSMHRMGQRQGRMRGGMRRGPGESRNSGMSHQTKFIRRLDKNGDRKVSSSEFDGPRHHFNLFDRNKDGFISESEAPKQPPPRR
jgi:Protein of unknown function (DUF1566)